MVYITPRTGANVDGLLNDMEEATEEGIINWTNTVAYPVDGLTKGTDGVVYKALVAQTGNNPVGDAVNWQVAYYDKDNISTAVPGGRIIVASDTAVLEDAGGVIYTNVAAVNTVTIPPNASVGFPLYTVLTGHQIGLGITSLVAGAGVTINVVATKGLDLTGQFAFWSAIKTGTDIWSLTGDLE